MGFFSWKSCKSKKSLPYDYCGNVVLVTPKHIIKGRYDGYGRIISPEVIDSIDSTSILEQVALDCGFIDKVEDFWDTSWSVEDKNGKVYKMGQDFKDYGEPIKEPEFMMPLFDCKDVNTLIAEGTLTRFRSTYDKVRDSIKLLFEYEYDPEEDTYESLTASENCEHQGFFYPQGYNNFPDDYVRDNI